MSQERRPPLFHDDEDEDKIRSKRKCITCGNPAGYHGTMPIGMQCEFDKLENEDQIEAFYDEIRNGIRARKRKTQTRR